MIRSVKTVIQAKTVVEFCVSKMHKYIFWYFAHEWYLHYIQSLVSVSYFKKHFKKCFLKVFCDTED